MSGALSIPGARLTEVGLVLPPDLSFERWEEVLALLGRLHRLTPWAIGDAVNFGEAKWGQRYAQALDLTGLSYETLRRYASVAERFDLCSRRRNLSFAVHAEAVSLPPAQREELLDRAEREGLRSRDVRELTSGKKSRREQIEEAARAVWRSSSLTVTKDGYVTPVEVMQSLGRLLDARKP